MKKIIVALAAAAALAGCCECDKQRKAMVRTNESYQTVASKKVEFRRMDNYNRVSLESTNGFQTAIMTVGDRKIPMKIAVSGSGMRMVGDEGRAEIHFKANEGVLTLDGKDISVSVVE